jgi:hypothetical protein
LATTGNPNRQSGTMSTRRVDWAITVAVALVCTIVLGRAIWVALQPQPLPPELQVLKNLSAQIEDEMTEAEVDAVFAGYQSSKTAVEREFTNHGKKLKRPSSFFKTYDRKGSIEGEFFVQVYFDYFGRVVGNEIGEWLR